jgi:hypothetical protein
MRWELNDLARRLDEQPHAVGLDEGLLPAPASSDSELSPDARRMLTAIDDLPEEEREVFSLVRIQGLTNDLVALDRDVVTENERIGQSWYTSFLVVEKGLHRLSVFTRRSSITTSAPSSLNSFGRGLPVHTLSFHLPTTQHSLSESRSSS